MWRAGQRCCAECGKAFEFPGTEDSEQIDWQVKITRIVWAAAPVPAAVFLIRGPATGLRAAGAQAGCRRGLFTAGFPGAAGV